MSGELGTNIPLQIQRQLRKECQYGCAICGCPLLKYAHIVPYERIHAFLPENMIPLCPTHYAKYDNGELSESLLRDARRSPHNRLHPQDVLQVDSEELVINVGKCKFINTYRILVVDDFDLITITRDIGNITFELTKQDTELYIIADLQYNGSTIRITSNEIFLDESELGTELKNSVLKNYDFGIAAYT
jgi:hypothetical protein